MLRQSQALKTAHNLSKYTFCIVLLDIIFGESLMGNLKQNRLLPAHAITSPPYPRSMFLLERKAHNPIPSSTLSSQPNHLPPPSQTHTMGSMGAARQLASSLSSFWAEAKAHSCFPVRLGRQAQLGVQGTAPSGNLPGYVTNLSHTRHQHGIHFTRQNNHRKHPSSPRSSSIFYELQSCFCLRSKDSSLSHNN